MRPHGFVMIILCVVIVEATIPRCLRTSSGGFHAQRGCFRSHCAQRACFRSRGVMVNALGAADAFTRPKPPKVTLRCGVPIGMAEATPASAKPTAVYALILGNLVIFFADKILRMPLPQRALYLYHARPTWYQPLTSTFCHASRQHLSGNVFLLLLFGRSVEDDWGWGGLLAAYAFCGIVANLVSLLLLPHSTVSIGASGAVFGLFIFSTLSKLTWRDLDWRKLCEVAVLGEFVFGKVLAEIRVASSGGIVGVNHVAHLAGAAAGAFLVSALRVALETMDRQERRRRA